MLIGEYIHTIDDKKRIQLPIKFRKEMGKKLVVTHGLEGCLFLYTEKEWNLLAKKISGMNLLSSETRGFNRFMLSGAFELEIDSVGRVLLPENLREFAKIKDKVVFAGVFTRIEIWDETRWNKYKNKVIADADAMAEKLGSIGAL
jgi:MraZ protein